VPLDNSEFQPHVPDAVRRQAELAEQLAREAGMAGAPEPETPSVEVVEPQEPVSEPEPASEPAAAPVVDWEQRYRTLQGKYDAEVPQLRRDLDAMRVLYSQMSAPAAPAPDEASLRPATTTTVVVPPEHVAEYGQELIDAAQQWARAAVSTELEALRNQVAELRGVNDRMQRVETMTTQQHVEAHLSSDPELANRWQALNVDPEFIGWLNRPDPFAGRLRMELFHDACGRGDGGRVGYFFKAFIAEHTAVNHVPTPTLQTPVPSEPVAERPTLEEMAAPGRAVGTGSSHGGAPAEKRLWTQPDIARFYRDRMRGVYAGREADAHALEQDILNATREGRIR
jgi:hypothetical protein